MIGSIDSTNNSNFMIIKFPYLLTNKYYQFLSNCDTRSSTNIFMVIKPMCLAKHKRYLFQDLKILI